MDDQSHHEKKSAPPPPAQPKANYSNRPRTFSRQMNPRKTAGSSPFNLIVRSLGLVGLMLGSFFSLMKRFFKGAGRREYRHLLQGLPALLMLGGVLYASFQVSLHRGEFLSNYKSMAYQASEAEQYDAALLYFRKLMKLDGGSAESQFAYAMVLDEMGTKLIKQGEALEEEDAEQGQKLIALGRSKRLDAMSTIEQLAPTDSRGFPKAHLHMARLMLANAGKYLVSEEGKYIPAGVKTLEHHLNEAEKSLKGTLEYEMAAFHFYMGMNQANEAVLHLEELAEKRPYLRYELMGLYARLGDSRNALVNLNLASDYYEQLVRNDPDNHLARARCANLRLNKGDYLGCVSLLEYGLTREESENNPYPQMLASTHVTIYDALTKRGDVPLEQRLAHLRQSLSYVTDYQPALARLAQLVSLTGEPGKQIETLLHRMIAEGRMPATGHFALGTKAWKEEDSDKALWHLERAYELDPGLGHTGNNLAWMLADRDPPQLDRALQIIDSVLEKFPKIGTFHDTKGFILMKMGMWEEALTELETALPAMRENIDIHKSLATVYRELQQPQLADEHDRIVADLEKAAKIKKATTDVNPFNPDLLKDPAEPPEQPRQE